MFINKLGLIAKLDIVETEQAAPRGGLQTANGHTPKNRRMTRNGNCVQGMLLEEKGYQVEAGELHYVGSKERVRVPLTKRCARKPAARSTACA